MDAVLFFAIAMTISATLLSYSRPETDDLECAKEGGTDPAELFDVFLRTSIGRRITLQIEGPAEIEASQDVASCIAMELTALRMGVEPGAFDGLNSLLEQMLLSICNPSLDPHLVALDISDPSRVMLALRGLPGEGENAFASSCEFALEDGVRCIAELVLCPAAPTELVDV